MVTGRLDACSTIGKVRHALRLRAREGGRWGESVSNLAALENATHSSECERESPSAGVLPRLRNGQRAGSAENGLHGGGIVRVGCTQALGARAGQVDVQCGCVVQVPTIQMEHWRMAARLPTVRLHQQSQGVPGRIPVVGSQGPMRSTAESTRPSRKYAGRPATSRVPRSSWR